MHCLVWNICATPVFTWDRGPRKISDSINDVSIHIGASTGPAPRFWTLIFYQKEFSPNLLTLRWNLRVLLSTVHQVSWALTTPMFSTLDLQDLQRGLLDEKDHKTVKRIVEEKWKQMPFKHFFRYPFAMTYSCSWSIVNFIWIDILSPLEHCKLVFLLCTSRSHLSDVSFLAEKTITDTSSLTLT